MNYTEFCKQRNQVVFPMLNLSRVTHYTRLLLWAGFAVGGQRTVRGGAEAFEHRGWNWWELRLEF